MQSTDNTNYHATVLILCILTLIREFLEFYGFYQMMKAEQTKT